MCKKNIRNERNDRRGREEMKWKCFIRMINLRNEKYDAIAGVSEIGGIILIFFIFTFCKSLLPFPFKLLYI